MNDSVRIANHRESGSPQRAQEESEVPGTAAADAESSTNQPELTSLSFLFLLKSGAAIL
jgi:hypothetical protein